MICFRFLTSTARSLIFSYPEIEGRGTPVVLLLCDINMLMRHKRPLIDWMDELLMVVK